MIQFSYSFTSNIIYVNELHSPSFHTSCNYDIIDKAKAY